MWIASKIFFEDESGALHHGLLDRDGQTCLPEPQLGGGGVKSTQLAPGRAKMSLVS